jgi:hypothetical protein
MQDYRPRPNLNCITDKNLLAKPGLVRSSSSRKSKKTLKYLETYRCDTPDRGGGKPENELGKKLSPDRLDGVSRPHLSSFEKRARIPLRNQFAKSIRSFSQTKNFVDLNQGAFSNKQSPIKKINSKAKRENLSQNWKAELQSPSVVPKPINTPIIPPKNEIPSSKDFLQTIDHMKPWQKYLHNLETT